MSATKECQAGKRMSTLDYVMLGLVAAGVWFGGKLALGGSLLTGFLVAAVCIMIAALIGELTGSE